MVSLVVPGGIGVREGAITAYLTLFDIGLADALTVSIASRLWYLVGEVLIFVAGNIVEFLSPHVGSVQ
jgi:uncharacterized membrane protein YbhN (UPF0104 family)